MSDTAPRPFILSPGPLSIIASGLRCRLEIVFPPALFEHAYVPPKVTSQVWAELTRRTPFIGLGWEALHPNGTSMNSLSGNSAWPVFVVTRNQSGQRQRYFGDKLAPGLFDLVSCAASVLHGFSLPNAGSMQVAAINSLAIEGHDDPDQAAAVIDVLVRTALPVEATIGNVAPGTLDRTSVQWSFDGGATALTETTTGGA